MNKVKTFLFFFLTLGFVFIMNYKVVQADMGPKPAIIVEIKGLEENEKYTVTFLGKSATAPFVGNYDHLNPNPVMDFKEGEYKFVGQYWEVEGDATVTWGYYPPSPFKVLILLEDGTFYLSNELEDYAFKSYFYMDMSEVQRGTPQSVTLVETVVTNYDMNQEIGNFFIRLGITIALEFVIALLFFYRNKYLLYTIIVNVITQILLNVGLNVFYFYTGGLGAMVLFFIAEVFVMVIEMIIYSILLKEKGTTRAILYTFVANIATFIASFYSLIDMIQK